jgi:peptide/nickel transport system permease protein
MPDDEELRATGSEQALLIDALPGQAVMDEMVMSRRSASAEPEGALQRKPLGLLFWIAIGFVSLVVLLAIVANLLPLPNPDYQNYGAINASPSIHHLLGTDDLGRDLLSRLIFGARVSLIVGFASVGIALAVGGSLGLISAFLGGVARHVC